MVENRAGRAEEKAAGAGKNAAAVQRLRPVLEAEAASVKDLIREAESPSGSARTGAPVAVGEAGEQPGGVQPWEVWDYPSGSEAVAMLSKCLIYTQTVTTSSCLLFWF